MPNVAYDPNNPTQAAFLSALALGESNGPNAYMQGTGGKDLSGYSTDQYGFPQWGGFGNSHAAGEFQFQPGTFDQYASTYDLNFHNPQDQNAAAWYYAQDTYRQKTGGELTDALSSQDYGSVQTALSSAWPSVSGNGATPGLAAALKTGQGAGLSTGNPISADTSGFDWSHPIQSTAKMVGDEIARFGILFIGGFIVLIALWYVLSDRGVVPSPGKLIKGVGKTVAQTAALAAVA